MAEKKVKAVKDKAVKDKEKKAVKAPKATKETKEIKTPKKDKAEEAVKEEPKNQAVEESNTLVGGEITEFSGKYIKAIGRRKRAIAKVRLYEDGKGIVMVNGLRASQYFSGEGANIIAQPLKVTGHNRDFNFSVLTNGGGKIGQIDAVRLGISRAILAFDPATKEALKVNGFLARDERKVERKKPGLRKARKAPQWSKR
jgi:small subunit ribosomal protein S9